MSRLARLALLGLLLASADAGARAEKIAVDGDVAPETGGGVYLFDENFVSSFPTPARMDEAGRVQHARQRRQRLSRVLPRQAGRPSRRSSRPAIVLSEAGVEVVQLTEGEAPGTGGAEWAGFGSSPTLDATGTRFAEISTLYDGAPRATARPGAGSPTPTTPRRPPPAPSRADR